MRTLERWWLRAAVVIVVVIAYAGLARWVLHGPVDARSLAVSVDRAMGSTVLGTQFLTCRRSRAPRTWTCPVNDPAGSGSDTYRVTVRRGSSCWTARNTFRGSEVFLPEYASGCVHRWQWTIFEPFP